MGVYRGCFVDGTVELSLNEYDKATLDKVKDDVVAAQLLKYEY